MCRRSMKTLSRGEEQVLTAHVEGSAWGRQEQTVSAHGTPETLRMGGARDLHGRPWWELKAKDRPKVCLTSS